MTKTPEELTADWKKGLLESGLYYVGNDKVKDFAFVKPHEISVYTLDSNIPMLLKDNAEILSLVPTYDEYKAMQAELTEFKCAITSYVGKPIDYDIACETVNKLLDDKEKLKKELAEHRIDKAKLEDENNTLRDLLYECLAHLSLGEIGTSVTPVNILLTRINTALGEMNES